MSKVKLHDALKASYSNVQSDLDGYKYDHKLSNDNEKVYFNPSDKKLLISIAGSHNLSDFGTDFMLASGHLKNTHRYAEADKILKKAKEKYHVDNATIAGHSLGATIGSYIAKPEDRFYGVDAGITVGQKIRSNPKHNNIRTAGDVISLLGEGAKHMTTLNNPNYASGFIPLDMLRSHNVDNIKNENIFL